MSVSKERLWEAYVKNNPRWESDGVSFTARGLRKFFDHVFDRGHSLGVENGRALEEMAAKPGRRTDPAREFMDLFSRL